MSRVRRYFRISVGSGDGMRKGCLKKSKTELLSGTESHSVARGAHRRAGEIFRRVEGKIGLSE
jgi:hypothetical protein